MVTELVLFDGLDFVDLDALSAGGSNESLWTDAGVGCRALSTIHASVRTDRLVAECASVSLLAEASGNAVDNVTLSAVVTRAATVRDIAGFSGEARWTFRLVKSSDVR